MLLELSRTTIITSENILQVTCIRGLQFGRFHPQILASHVCHMHCYGALLFQSQAVMTAALLARKDAGRVTVLVVAEPGTTASEPDKQVETITW